MALQNTLRGIEIRAGRYDGIQTLILDLIDIDGGIPSSKQGRRAYTITNLRGQGVHLITEDALVIGKGCELVVARVATQFSLECSNQLMPIDLKRIFRRPKVSG